MPQFPDDPGAPGDLANGANVDSTKVLCRGGKMVLFLITATNHPGDQALTYTPKFAAIAGAAAAATLAAANAVSLMAPAAGADLTVGGMLAVRAGQATADPCSRFGAVECWLNIASAGATTLTGLSVTTTVFQV